MKSMIIGVLLFAGCTQLIGSQKSVISKPPYLYAIVALMECPYCRQVQQVVPCTPCAEKILPEAIKKFGHEMQVDSTVNRFVYDDLDELLNPSYSERRLNLKELLTADSANEIVRFESLRAKSKCSIYFNDRQKVMAALGVKVPEPVTAPKSDDGSSDSWKTVSLAFHGKGNNKSEPINAASPLIVKKTTSTASNSSCCLSCVIL